MRARVRNWGNSLAVRIPKPFASEVGLDEDCEVEISVSKGTLVVTPARKRFELKELVAQIRPKNRHGETSFGRPVGREAW